MKHIATRTATVALLASLLLTAALPARAASSGQPGYAQDVGGGRWTLTGGSMVQVASSDGLNLRQSPSTDASILAIYPVGSQLRVLETQGAWLRVLTGSGQTGWVHSDFVSRTAAPVPVVARVTMSKGSGTLQMEITGAFAAAAVSGDARQVTVRIPDQHTPSTVLPVTAYAVGSVTLDSQGVRVAFDAPYGYRVVDSSPGRVLLQFRPADLGNVSIASRTGTDPARPDLLQTDVAPLILDGTALVPVRPLAEWLGARVEWSADRNAVVAVGLGHTIVLPLGQPAALVDGVDETLVQPAFIQGGRTLVPLRFFTEAFGVKVGWQAQTQEITLAADGRYARLAVPAASSATLAEVRESLRASARATEVSRGNGRRVRQTLQMTASEYAIGDGMTPNTYTFTGLPAKRGVVAVDPNVIPLGTRLYIEGYGEAIAADTGSAIKGNRIDLCVDSVAEANAFGMQQVTVEILQ